MTSFWILLILLFSGNINLCGCSNSGKSKISCNECSRGRNEKKKEKKCDCANEANEFPRFGPPPVAGDCGCGSDFIQPRPFFQEQNTCGCENKSE